MLGVLSVSNSNKEFLTFRLGKEEFAVEINRVQEIRGWQPPSALPNVPDFVKGVVDLRGLIVPIIDLRVRFGITPTDDGTTVVIVVHVLTQQGERVVGLVVDAVSDVHNFDMSKLQPPPDISDSIDSQFILGLSTMHTNKLATSNAEPATKAKGIMVILIDLDKLTSEGLIEQISNFEPGQIGGNG